ncbi:hypothetical protein, partial [Enterobacter hormaechei]|uniref:hypothetical protein n=2 Tax=Enterobacter hormaechei TaxID=158836 RepID=UPI001969A790
MKRYLTSLPAGCVDAPCNQRLFKHSSIISKRPSQSLIFFKRMTELEHFVKSYAENIATHRHVSGNIR